MNKSSISLRSRSTPKRNQMSMRRTNIPKGSSVRPSAFLSALPPSYSPSSPEVSGVLSLLAPRGEEKKAGAYGRDQPVDPPPPALDLEDSKRMLAVAKSVFRPGKTYRFRLTRAASLTASGAGALLIATPVYPGQYTEYTALASLFSEARLHRTRITYCFISTGSVPILQPIASSFDPQNTGAPTFTYACQQPGAKLFPMQQTTPAQASNEWVATQPRVWSAINNTGTGTDPVSGCAGNWYTCAAGATTASVVVCYYMLISDYELRNPT